MPIIKLWLITKNLLSPFKVFQLIENSNEVETLTTHQAILVTERKLFINSVGNISKNRANYREVSKQWIIFQYDWFPPKIVDQLLSNYESVVSEAAGAGIDIITQDFTISWDYIQSVFFSTTILTTISKYPQSSFLVGNFIYFL